jgi:multicomponent Na+:H+ antiporter subunit B
MIVFLAGTAGLAALFAAAFTRMPAFGTAVHLYRTLAVHASVSHRTANVVSSVNFDLRGLDTFGEETILLTSVVGAAVLLRPSEGETRREPRRPGRTLEVTRLLGYLLLPVTLIVGFDVVAHGHLTPGGGFQGGVVLATGLFLLYVTDSYQAMVRLRPMPAFQGGETLGAAAFAAIGVAGLALTGAFLANFLDKGTFGQLFSAGTVPVLNAVVGVEVACSMIILITHFLEQDIEVTGTEAGHAMAGTGAR